MDDATKRYVAAGAIGHLCLYHYKHDGTHNGWAATTNYAARTFPDASPAVIAELIAICVEACHEAAHYAPKLRMLPCGESADSSKSSG